MSAIKGHKKRHNSGTSDLKRKRQDKERCEIVSREGRHKSEKKKTKREKEESKGIYTLVLFVCCLFVCLFVC